MKAEKRFMEMAIAKALAGIKNNDSPFGACIVKNGRVIAVAHSTVLTGRDATNHAEMNAIRLACKKLKTHELRGCTVYSTTEPCPMCFSAIHWAKADTIVFGTAIADATALGFHELSIRNAEMKRRGGSPLKLSGGFMKKECLALLAAWKKKRGKAY